MKHLYMYLLISNCSALSREVYFINPLWIHHWIVLYNSLETNMKESRIIPTARYCRSFTRHR